MKAKLYLAILFLFLAFEVFGGALRYLFSTLGAPWLVYLPKALILAALLGVLLETAYRGKISRTLLFSALVIGAYAVVGAYNTGNALQPLFSIFSMLPLVFGIVVAPYLDSGRIVKYTVLLWLCAATGIVIDYFIAVPWDGAAYSLGNVELSASRDWTSYGVERVAGFSRASFDAADQILFLSLPIIFLARPKLLKFIVWLAAGVLIALTTSKTKIGVYALFTLLLLSMTVLPRIGKRVLGKTLPIVIATVGAAFPISTLFVAYQLNLKSFTSMFLFSSFGERLTQMWPDAFKLVSLHGNLILGRGLGGIGVAQSYFEPGLANSADSVYVYLYASFGLLAIPLVALYVNRVRNIDLRANWPRLLWFLGIAVLLSGWTVNVVESAYTAIVLGITLRAATLRSRKRPNFRPISVQRMGIARGEPHPASHHISRACGPRH